MPLPQVSEPAKILLLVVGASISYANGVTEVHQDLFVLYDIIVHTLARDEFSPEAGFLNQD